MAAVLLALWLGLTAPAVSPVTGLAPAGSFPPAAVQESPQDDVQGDTAPPAVDPQLVPDGGRRERVRR